MILSIPLFSLATVPAFIIIFLTALFGLNDVQLRHVSTIGKRRFLVELALGVSFLVTAWTTFMIAAASLLGGNVMSWRGCLMCWGIAGIFGLVGKFAPWRYWLKRVVDDHVPAPGAPPA